MGNGIHFRATRAEIDRDALAHNAQLIRENAAGAKVLGVIKADGYGHGVISTANAIAAHVDAFAVAFIDEALQLREAGFSLPIVLLEGCLSAAELPICAHHNLQPVVHEPSQLDAILTSRLVRPLAVWLKVDTGMHRLGWHPQEVARVYRELEACPNVGAITLMSHYANSGDSEHPLTQQQNDLFSAVCAETAVTESLSIANSAALLSSSKDFSTLDGHWVRTGLTLYGVAPRTPDRNITIPLRPVMRLVAPVIALREISAGETVGYGSRWQAKRKSLIATVAIGYADGYPRHCPDGTPVYLNGVEVPLVGTVSMDMITIDVTDLDAVQVGDEVELWGPNLPVDRIAEAAGTISYELLCRVSSRVPRVEI